MQERAAELMEQVRSMFKDTTDILQTMDLVDSIQLLGLSYHFEKEISAALKRVHDADLNCHGLYETALRFRLLRQEGYHVTPGKMLLRFLGVDNKHSHMFAGRLETRGQTHRPTDGKALHEIDCGTRRPIMSAGLSKIWICSDSAVLNNATLCTRLKVVEFSFIPTQLNTSAHNHLYFGKADATALPSSRNTLS
ncbi:unnamed protein product [Musa acuminata var. zebrina]